MPAYAYPKPAPAPEPQSATAPSPLSFRMKLTLTAASFLIGLAMCELIAQVAGYVQWRGMQNLHKDPMHYYLKSHNPELVYSLKPGLYTNDLGLDLLIGPEGFRIDPNSKVPAGAPNIAFLGDSNIFGIESPTKETLPVMAEAALKNRFHVFNLSVPGYGFREARYFYDEMSAKHSFKRLFFFMNLNDFALRDSSYEGADNGLYRMYHKAFWQLPWYINKARYRYYKGKDSRAAPEWYQWLYQGTKDVSLGYLKELVDIARKQQTDLCVVIVPASGSFSKKGYALTNIHEGVESYLKSIGVDFIDTTTLFADDPNKYFDETEHMLFDGNKKLLDRMIHSQGSCGLLTQK